MLCSISGHVPETPVLSLKSGLLFEKRLIEHEITENGVCPVTKEPLTFDDLIEVKTDKSVKPRSSTANSIPGLLGIFHDEWDALMLECHSLRQSLTTARQELSHALYQHDAACRVIARLIRERDAAKETLLKIRQQSSKRDLPEDEPSEENPIKKMHVGITDEISNLILTASKEIAEKRGEFAVADETVTSEDVQEYSILASQPLHATKQGGILSLSFHPTSKNVIATAGEDSTIKIFDYDARRILTSIEEHFKKVQDVTWIEEHLLVSCSSDPSVRIWMRNGDDWTMECGLHIKEHEDDVVAVTSAYNGRFVISASKDTTLGFTDLEAGRCLERIRSPVVDVAYSCARFHSDGRLLATGTDAGDVHIWDMTQQRVVQTFTHDTSEPIYSLSFHQDAVHLATASDQTIHLWDIRKMESTKVMKPYDDGSIRSVAYDTGGRFLAVGGRDLRIYDTERDVTPVTSFSDFPNHVRCVRFGDNAMTIAAGSSDHNLRIFGQG